MHNVLLDGKVIATS